MKFQRPSILDTIAKTGFALALTLLGGGAASADGLTVQQRAQAEMNKGKDYAAAWQAATRADVSSVPQGLIARVNEAADQMNRGKDYLAAREASHEASGVIYTPEQVAKAKRAREAMNEGMDYVAAWQAAQSLPPTTGRASLAGTPSTIK
jgi:hypothetical protein